MNSSIKITPTRRSLSMRERIEADRERRRLEASPILFLLYLGGLLSMLFVFVESGFLSMGIFIMAGIAVSLISAALWYVYFYKTVYFVFLVIGLCVIAMLLGAWQIPQMAHMFNDMFHGRGMNIGFGVLALMVIAAMFILFSMEFIFRRHSVMFILAGAEVIAGPMIELKASFVTIILIVIFQFAFMVLNMTKVRPRKQFTMKNRAYVSNASALVIAFALLAAFIPGVIIQKIYEDPLFLGVYQADAVVKDTVDKIMGNYGGTEINGSVSRGNLRQTGEVAFELKTKDLPKDKLYFRTFTGSSYYGDYWDESFWMFLKPFEDTALERTRDPYDVRDDALDDVPDDDEDDNGEVQAEYIYTDQANYDTIVDVVESYKGAVYSFAMEFLQNITDDMVFSIGGISGEQINIGVSDPNGNMKITFYIQYSPSFVLNPEEVSETGEVTSENVKNGDYLWVLITMDDPEKYSALDYQVEDGMDYAYSGYLPPSKEALERADKYMRKYPESADHKPMEEYGYAVEGTQRSFIYDLKKYPALRRILNYPSILSSGNSSDFTNDIVYALSEADAAPNQMRVTTQNGIPSVPYFVKATQGNLMMNNGMKSNNDSYTYQTAFMSVNDITAKNKWEENPNYRYAMERYAELAKDYYTYYDIGKLPRLTELCQGKDFYGDLDTVTTFILYTLQNNAKYDVNPGSTPWNKDPAEYFLFDNHKGYCVHYATVAANMYHMLGIPARYVAGYVVDPVFLSSTDSNDTYYKYKTTVTDYTAHAWVEVFLPDYGWVVVDATPDEFNRMHVSYPGYDEETMDRIMREHGWSFSEPSRSADNGAGGIGGGLGGLGAANVSVPMLFIVLLAAAVIFVVIVLVRRAVIVSRFPKEGCGRAFDRMIRALHYSGLMKDMNGSEGDFGEALSAALDCISPDRARELVDIMQRNCFSPVRADEEETEKIRNARADIISELYDKLPFRKRLVFKYIKALI